MNHEVMNLFNKRRSGAGLFDSIRIFDRKPEKHSFLVLLAKYKKPGDDQLPDLQAGAPTVCFCARIFWSDQGLRVPVRASTSA